MTDDAALGDLVAFARIEVDSHDLEPWAELLAAVAASIDAESALWLVKLYNAYDSLGSAWSVYRRWPGPMAWTVSGDGADAAGYPCTQERRGLRGGKVLHHLDTYVALLAGMNQDVWIRQPLAFDCRERDFLRLSAHLRRVWGVGRQTAFEWAEFLAKVNGIPVTAPDAQLWESEGPRRSLQRLYGNPRPSAAWLDEHAHRCRQHLADEGIELAWEDFETVICDFNVMRDGRYYPGRHLAALREEIDEIADRDDRAMLLDLFEAIIPEPWNRIPPGIDKQLLAAYRDGGAIVTPVFA